MAIDYLLAVGCEPQRALGAERLVALSRTRTQVRGVLEHLRSDGDTRDPREITIQLTTHRQGASEDGRGVTLADLLRETSPLDEQAPECERCPAKLVRAFGCHERIRYPIPERSEAWLMARLPESLATTAGVFLVRALADFGWDGAPVAKLRAAGTTYFESKVAYGVRWQGDDGLVELSSDQLFQMMFMLGPTLAPAHCLMLALFLGVIPHDTSLHDLKDAAGRTRAIGNAHVPSEPDPDIEQLAGFLRMLALAARLDVPIVVDG
ncbi:MAG TPA: hypothetical protein VGG74_30575 [Kofleriaceae bacterium]|jgi:hypothetical protein